MKFRKTIAENIRCASGKTNANLNFRTNGLPPHLSVGMERQVPICRVTGHVVSTRVHFTGNGVYRALTRTLRDE